MRVVAAWLGGFLLGGLFVLGIFMAEDEFGTRVTIIGTRPGGNDITYTLPAGTTRVQCKPFHGEHS